MRFRSTIYALLAAAAIQISAAESLATLVVPSEDAFVSSANAANNYGAAGALPVSAAGLAKGEFQSLLKFDLSTVKAGFDATFGAGNWTLQSATLQLTAGTPNNALFNSPSASGQIAASWMLNDSWVEGTGTPAAPGATGVTWNTLPSFLSGSDESLGALSFSGSNGAVNYALSVSPGLNADAMSGNLASIRLIAADATVSGFFNSRSFGTTTLRPSLDLTAIAVPETSAFLLTGFGLTAAALFACFSKRRRRNVV